MLLPNPSLVSKLLGRSVQQMTAAQSESLDIYSIQQRIESFRKVLHKIKNDMHSSLANDFAWCPYESLMNFYPLENVLAGDDRSILKKVGGKPVLDLGCGDGDLSYFLELLGCLVHAVDYPPTNFNQMRGVRALKQAMQSSVEIFEANLDDRFELPAPQYGLAFFCGILYHLKNPYYALETLARHATYCVLSTRVARLTPDNRVRFQDQPMAYLLDAGEANGDSTNYWIFSEAGLKRILNRCGWDVRGCATTGDTRNSNPSSDRADERAFCFLESRVCVT